MTFVTTREPRGFWIGADALITSSLSALPQLNPRKQYAIKWPSRK